MFLFPPIVLPAQAYGKVAASAAAYQACTAECCCLQPLPLSTRMSTDLERASRKDACGYLLIHRMAHSLLCRSQAQQHKTVGPLSLL